MEVFIGNFVVMSILKWFVMWNKTEIVFRGVIRIVFRNFKNRKKYSVEFVVVKENFILFIGV